MFSLLVRKRDSEKEENQGVCKGSDGVNSDGVGVDIQFV